MKQALRYICLLFLLALFGCASTRTTTSATEQADIKVEGQTEQKEVTDLRELAAVNTERTENTKVIIEFECTEYYDKQQPAPPDSCANELASKPSGRDSKPPDATAGNVKAQTKGRVIIDNTIDSKEEEAKEVKQTTESATTEQTEVTDQTETKLTSEEEVKRGKPFNFFLAGVGVGIFIAFALYILINRK